MGGGALLPPLARAVGGHSHPADIITPPPSPPLPSRTVANFQSRQSIPSISTASPDAGPSRPLDSIFGPLPSTTELEKAMSDLRCFMQEISAARRELSWLCSDHSRTVMQSSGFGRLCDAFHMLQTEPSVQKMVLSIACDKAVWDAIMNNPAVQDLQGLLFAGTAGLHETMQFYSCKDEEESLSSSPEKLDMVAVIMKWIMDILELVQKIGTLAGLIFQPAEDKAMPTSELSGLVEEKIRSSFLLSIVLLFIVVATRIHEH
ncbi:PREDICTED: uncharacterized protein LOC109155570 isoform X2 [Ipomoea nil]|uniref:uncharacterized protein LOC109155570 isoform X2 n=1 Tax=Ipomoea nil TaxID=35883 RepID=UPI000901432C|nr:PREDICTED: uncharacterized protein LOC109155570 isoform X2 [Ipomoea nil]